MQNTARQNYYSSDEKIWKVAKMAFLTFFKAIVRENGEIVAHFQ